MRISHWSETSKDIIFLIGPLRVLVKVGPPRSLVWRAMLHIWRQIFTQRFSCLDFMCGALRATNNEKESTIGQFSLGERHSLINLQTRGTTITLPSSDV